LVILKTFLLEFTNTNLLNVYLIKIKEGDKREELSYTALGQPWVKKAAVDFVIAAVYKRTTRKYRKRGIRYVHIEVGHAAQNLLL